MEATDGGVAQRVEHPTFTRVAQGSNPCTPTIFKYTIPD